MPPVRTPVPKVGSGLNRKSIGGLPLWAVIAGSAVSVFLVYKLYKNYQSGATSAATQPAAAATPADTSGGAGSTGTGTADQSTEDLATALNGLTAFLGGGSSGSFTTTSGDGSTPGASGSTTTSDSNNTTTNNTTTTTNNNYPPPSSATKSPTHPGTSSEAASSGPLGIAIPNPTAAQLLTGSGLTASQTQALAKKALTPPQIPSPPTHAATLVQPERPVAGTTSNKDAAARSKTLH